jgi:hypothetical protein
MDNERAWQFLSKTKRDEESREPPQLGPAISRRVSFLCSPPTSTIRDIEFFAYPMNPVKAGRTFLSWDRDDARLDGPTGFRRNSRFG